MTYPPLTFDQIVNFDQYFPLEAYQTLTRHFGHRARF